MDTVQTFSYVSGWCLAISVAAYFSLPACAYIVTRIAYLVATASLTIISFVIPLLKELHTGLQDALASEGSLSNEKKMLTRSLNAAKEQIEDLEIQNGQLRQMNVCSRQLIETSTIALQQMGIGWKEEIDERLCLGFDHDARHYSEYNFTTSGSKFNTRTDGLSESLHSNCFLNSIPETTTLIRFESPDINERRYTVEKELEASQIERVIRQRITQKLDAAFAVCRKRGTFRLDSEVMSEPAISAGDVKSRVDSIVISDDFLTKIRANESRGIVPNMIFI